jgi:hypothetical protein
MNEDPNEQVETSNGGTPEGGPKHVEIAVNDEAILVSSLRLSAKRDGQVFAHRESGSIPQQSDSAVADDGSVHSILRGTPSQGEQSTLEVCRGLFRTLQQRKHRWHLPHLAPEHDDCDCLSQSLDSVNELLRVQLVRVVTDSTIWRELAQRGHHTTAAPSSHALAEGIRGAIEKKAQKTALGQRARLALALDATTTSAFALGAVIRSFRDGHGSWCKELGFRAIWLVGPSSDMTYRLDERDAGDAA